MPLKQLDIGKSKACERDNEVAWALEATKERLVSRNNQSSFSKALAATHIPARAQSRVEDIRFG